MWKIVRLRSKSDEVVLTSCKKRVLGTIVKKMIALYYEYGFTRFRRDRGWNRPNLRVNRDVCYNWDEEMSHVQLRSRTGKIHQHKSASVGFFIIFGPRDIQKSL